MSSGIFQEIILISFVFLIITTTVKWVIPAVIIGHPNQGHYILTMISQKRKSTPRRAPVSLLK